MQSRFQGAHRDTRNALNLFEGITFGAVQHEHVSMLFIQLLEGLLNPSYVQGSPSFGFDVACVGWDALERLTCRVRICWSIDDL